jgi:hypothetical protein
MVLLKWSQFLHFNTHNSPAKVMSNHPITLPG